MIDVDYEGFWVGLQSPRTWVFSDTQTDVAHWMLGEPNLQGAESCTVSVYAAGGSDYPGMWHDGYCEGSTRTFVCERPKSGKVLTTSVV